MNKLIATGELVKTENTILSASVYVELDADGKESTEAGKKYAVVKLSARDADALPTDALSFADIMSAAESEESGASASAVPGFDGHADIALTTPVSVAYSKTKAFVAFNGKPQIYAQMRFYF